MVGVHDRLHCHRLDSHANSLTDGPPGATRAGFG